MCLMFSGCQGQSRTQTKSSQSSIEVTKTSSVEESVQESSRESWKDVENLAISSKRDMVRYYQDYMENIYPEVGITDTDGDCLKKFRKEHPEIYDEMVKPLPVYLEDEDANVIVYYKDDGNIYWYLDNEQLISS